MIRCLIFCCQYQLINIIQFMKQNRCREYQLRNQELNWLSESNYVSDFSKLQFSQVENCDPVLFQADSISFQEVHQKAVYDTQDREESQVGIYIMEGLINLPPEIEIRRYPTRERKVKQYQGDGISKAKVDKCELCNDKNQPKRTPHRRRRRRRRRRGNKKSSETVRKKEKQKKQKKIQKKPRRTKNDNVKKVRQTINGQYSFQRKIQNT